MLKLKSKKRNPDRNVIVNDDIMIIDLQQAKKPGVVRLILTDLAFAHFYVRSTEEGSQLGYSTQSDDFVVLGTYNDRIDADQVLRDIRLEMLKLERLHKFFSLRTLGIAAAIMAGLMVVTWLLGRIPQQRLPELNDPLPFEDQATPMMPVPPSMQRYLNEQSKLLGVPPSVPPVSPASPPGLPQDADTKLKPPAE